MQNLPVLKKLPQAKLDKLNQTYRFILNLAKIACIFIVVGISSIIYYNVVVANQEYYVDNKMVWGSVWAGLISVVAIIVILIFTKISALKKQIVAQAQEQGLNKEHLGTEYQIYVYLTFPRNYGIALYPNINLDDYRKNRK